MRVIIPAVFLAAVYVPLRRALDEVTWEVRSRDAIRHIVAAQAPQAVQTSIAVERHTVSLHLVLIGSNERAASVQRNVETAIAASTGVVPTVAVTAVADAKTLATTAAISHAPNTGAPDVVDLATIRQRVATAIAAEWPTSVAGPLAGWELVVPSRATPTIAVRHIGPPIGSTAQQLLANRWETRVGARIDVLDVPLTTAAVADRLGREREWYTLAHPLLDWAGDADRAVVCVSAPIGASRHLTNGERAILAAVRESAVSKAGRLVLSDSSGWNVTVGIQPCAGRSPSGVASDSSRGSAR